MNQNDLRQLNLNFSGIGCWLTAIAGAWLLGALGLGWLVKSFVVLVLLLLLAPIVAFVGFRWWLQRNVIQADCPVCSFNLTGLNGTQSICPNCGTALQAQAGAFQRIAQEGTIDVEAVDVVDVLVEPVDD